MSATKRRRKPVGTAAGIAGQLREIITARNLTAYSVAHSAGIATSVVSRFLSRERGLTLDTFDAIAGALGLRLIETARGRRTARSTSTVPDGADSLGRMAEVPDACQADEVPTEVDPDLCQVAEPEPLPPEPDASPAAEAEVRSGLVLEVEPPAQPEAGPVKPFFLGPFAIGNQTDEPIGAE